MYEVLVYHLGFEKRK